MNFLTNYTSTYSHPPLVQSPLVYKPKRTRTSVMYTNDLHGQIPKMQRLVSAAKGAEIRAKQFGYDIFKFSSGDTFIGSDEKRNSVAASFLNTSGMDAHALGNHEFDITASICGNLLNNSNTKMLGMNLNFPNNNSCLSRKIQRSTILSGQNGEKYGVIGIQPTDLRDRIKKKEILEGITVDDKEQTIRELQQEVRTLQQQGVNKIFLLSHAGNAFEKEIAQRVSGIDVIFGGHSHELIEGIKSNENLFYSPTGEPVVITQAGRDGNHFGILDVEFDEYGTLKAVQNNVLDTNIYSPDPYMTQIVDATLGKSPEIGNLAHVDPIPKNNLLEENPWADFVADAIRTRLDADVVLINSANFRGSVDKGVVTERDITSIFPFNNKLFKVKLSEEDLVDAIKHCAKSLKAKNSKPGIMQVSGLTYKLDKQGNLLELSYVDKNGHKRFIDINDPDDDRIYTAVYDEFLVGGGDNMEMLEKDDDEIIERYQFDKDKVTIDYIKTLRQPFSVYKDNRIQIV